jgi:hypothetical protein
MPPCDLQLRGSDVIDPASGGDGSGDVAAADIARPQISGTRWGYEELSTVTEISREAGLPVHAHFGQMWAFPAVGNGVDPDEALP